MESTGSISSQTKYERTREECEPEEHGGPLPPVLAVVGGEVEPHDEAHRGQGAEQAKVPEEAVDHVEVGAGGGRQHRHGQVHVHGLQVRPHRRLAGRKEEGYKCDMKTVYLRYMVSNSMHYLLLFIIEQFQTLH